MALASPNLRSSGCVCVGVLVEADAVGRRVSVTASMGFTFLDAHERGHDKKKSWNAHTFAIRVRHRPLSACA